MKECKDVYFHCAILSKFKLKKTTTNIVGISLINKLEKKKTNKKYSGHKPNK